MDEIKDVENYYFLTLFWDLGNRTFQQTWNYKNLKKYEVNCKKIGICRKVVDFVVNFINSINCPIAFSELHVKTFNF